MCACSSSDNLPYIYVSAFLDHTAFVYACIVLVYTLEVIKIYIVHSFSDACMIRYTNSILYNYTICYNNINNKIIVHNTKWKTITENSTPFKIVCYCYRRLEG